MASRLTLSLVLNNQSYLISLTFVLWRFCSDVIADVAAYREASCAPLRKRLEDINRGQLAAVTSHVQAAVNNYIANAKWRFVDANGDRIAKVLVDKEPLMWK